MCSCNLKLLQEGFSGRELFQDQDLRETLTQYKMISKQGFEKGEILPTLQYAWCLDADQFQRIFKNVGITITADVLPILAEVIRRGDDKSGQLHNDAGVPVHIDALEMVKNMRFTPQQIQNASCSTIFA